MYVCSKSTPTHTYIETHWLLYVPVHSHYTYTILHIHIHIHIGIRMHEWNVTRYNKFSMTPSIPNSPRMSTMNMVIRFVAPLPPLHFWIYISTLSVRWHDTSVIFRRHLVVCLDWSPTSVMICASLLSTSILVFARYPSDWAFHCCWRGGGGNWNIRPMLAGGLIDPRQRKNQATTRKPSALPTQTQTRISWSKETHSTTKTMMIPRPRSFFCQHLIQYWTWPKQNLTSSKGEASMPSSLYVWIL